MLQYTYTEASAPLVLSLFLYSTPTVHVVTRLYGCLFHVVEVNLFSISCVYPSNREHETMTATCRQQINLEVISGGGACLRRGPLMMILKEKTAS